MRSTVDRTGVGSMPHVFARISHSDWPRKSHSDRKTSSLAVNAATSGSSDALSRSWSSVMGTESNSSATFPSRARRDSSHMPVDGPVESTSPMPATSVSDSSGRPTASAICATAPSPTPHLRLASMWRRSIGRNTSPKEVRRSTSSASVSAERSGRFLRISSTVRRSSS